MGFRAVIVEKWSIPKTVPVVSNAKGVCVIVARGTAMNVMSICAADVAILAKTAITDSAGVVCKSANGATNQHAANASKMYFAKAVTN